MVDSSPQPPDKQKWASSQVIGRDFTAQIKRPIRSALVTDVPTTAAGIERTDSSPVLDSLKKHLVQPVTTAPGSGSATIKEEEHDGGAYASPAKSVLEVKHENLGDQLSDKFHQDIKRIVVSPPPSFRLRT